MNSLLVPSQLLYINTVTFDFSFIKAQVIDRNVNDTQASRMAHKSCAFME